MPDMNEICKTAWDSTKKEHQPLYDTLEQSYKEMLINRVGAIKGGVEMKDGPFTAFDSRVASQLKAPVAEVPPEVKEELVEEAVAEQEPIRLVSQGGAVIAPDPMPEAPKGTISVETEGGKTSATVNLLSESEKEHVQPKGPLPKDYPKHELLHEAGINTYGQLFKCDDLTTIEGIGPATAKEIAKRLRADERALNK